MEHGLKFPSTVPVIFNTTFYQSSELISMHSPQRKKLIKVYS